MFPYFVYLHAYCTISKTTNTAGQQSRFNIAIFVSARRVLRLTHSASLLYGIVASPGESGQLGPRRQKKNGTVVSDQLRLMSAGSDT